MGSPKQLLQFGQRTLLQHVVTQAVDAGFRRIVAVTGANAAEVEASLADMSVEIVRNSRWESGMGSSITAGVRYLLEGGSALTAMAILLGDQPLIRANHLSAMRNLLETSDCPMVAARYGGTVGAPAFFKREMFSALESLSPAVGARHLFSVAGDKLALFDLPEAAVDIDTPDDFAALGRIPE
jgi:molybdenum cofactor cytidylyltransferase